MAKFSFTQNTLAAGEISKSAWGESAQEHYANGCEKLKNVLLSKDGVQEKRPGTIHVNALRHPQTISYPDANTTPVYSKYARLFPFSFQSAGASPRSVLVIVEPREISWAWDSEEGEYVAEVNPNFRPSEIAAQKYGIKLLDTFTNQFYSLDASSVDSWLSSEPAPAWSGFSLTELRSARCLQIENSLILYSPNSIPVVINIDIVSGYASLLTWWDAVSIRAILVDKLDYSFKSGSTLPDKIKEGAGVSFYWLAQVYRDLFPNLTITFTTTTVGTDRAFTVSSTSAVLNPGCFLKVSGTSTGYAIIQTYDPNLGTGTAKIVDAVPDGANSFMVGILGYRNIVPYTGRGGDSDGVDEFLYPISDMSFFENRLIIGLGGLIAGSQIQSYGEFDFTGDASNDRPFVFRLLNSKPSYINWMISGKSLKIGTSHNELLVTRPDSTLSMGLANVSVNAETYNGSALRPAIEFSGNVIFVSKDRRTPLVQYFNRDQSAFRIANLLEFAEDIFKRSYEQGRDLSFASLVDMRYTSAAAPARLIYTRDAVANHFLNYHSNAPEIYEMALQQSADTLWVLDSFGCLYSAKLEGNSASWSHHVLGGTRGSGEAPFVISICSLPDSTLGSDSIFMLVEREINSEKVVTLEKILDAPSPSSAMTLFPNSYFDPLDPPSGEDAFTWYIFNTWYAQQSANQKNILHTGAYMDSAVFLGSFEPTNKFGKNYDDFSYISHLEGETVQVFSEGFYIGDFVVTNGEITLPKAYPWVIVGLKYEAEIIPVPPQFGALDGSSEGHKRRIHAATVRFHRTLDAKMGPNGEDNQVQEINFRPAGLAASEPTPFFNGLKQVQGFSDYGLEGSVRIVSDKPYPMGVVCVNFKGQVNEG